MAKNNRQGDKAENGPLSFGEEPVVEDPGEDGRGGDMPGGEEDPSPKTPEDLEKIAEDDTKRRDEVERRSPNVGFEPMGEDEEEPPDFGLETLAAFAASGPVRDELDWSRENERKLQHREAHPRRELPSTVDPHDLKKTGWGVVFARGADPRVEAELRPLLDQRQRQAGSLFRKIVYRPGESGRTFLWSRHGETPGVIDPKVLPYYLLIVGGPEEIPFEIQYMLSINHAVGRIAFDRPEAYGRYARAVRNAEMNGVKRSRRVDIFSVEGDRQTELLARHLTEPFARQLPELAPGWDLVSWRGALATRERLGRLLNGESPGLLVLGAHGARFPAGHESQIPGQGAVRCHGGKYFRCNDVSGEARLDGQVVVSFACYGAGTPVRDNFPEDPQNPAAISERPFVACLPQTLLERGALAFVGHVDRGWTLSFAWQIERGEEWVERTAVNSLFDALGQLLRGERLGHAMRPLSRRYAAIAALLADQLERYDSENAVEKDRSDLFLQWTAHNDARNVVVLGDPAVYILGRRPMQG